MMPVNRAEGKEKKTKKTKKEEARRDSAAKLGMYQYVLQSGIPISDEARGVCKVARNAGPRRRSRASQFAFIF